MTVKNPWMTNKELEAALIRLGLGENWAAAARRLDITPMHLYRLRTGKSAVPRQTADLVRCWLATGARVEAR